MRIVAHGYRGCTLILEDERETFVKVTSTLSSSASDALPESLSVCSGAL